MLLRITPTSDFAALVDCELVIEAVFEDRAVKAAATQKAEAVLKPDTIFASKQIEAIARIAGRAAATAALTQTAGRLVADAPFLTSS